MSRRRTDEPGSHRGVAALAIVGLGAAAMHAAWARGSTWPADDREQLTNAVVGTSRRPDGDGSGFPGKQATWMVVGLLSTAAAITAARAGLVPAPGGRDSWPVRTGSKIVASTLLARGVGGLVVSGLDLVSTTPEFRRWNLRVYSPLCLALGSAVAVVSTSAGEPG